MDGRIATEVERPARPGASSGSRMGQFGLLSLAASNGTLLNEPPLKSGEHLLKHGDIVEIASGLVLRYFHARGAQGALGGAFSQPGEMGEAGGSDPGGD